MLIEDVLGNLDDPLWKERLAAGRVDTLSLDQWEAQKNRLRKLTDGGVEVALSLDRAVRMHDGDVLHWDEAGATAIVARIALGEVMVVDLGGVAGAEPAVLVRTAVELGHALGNQHWPAVVKESSVYVPLTVDRKVMDAVMRTHALAGVTHEFRPGAEVIPFLAPHEARRLFGGADATPHTHHAGSR
jgi:urease accessory protein